MKQLRIRCGTEMVYKPLVFEGYDKGTSVEHPRGKHKDEERRSQASRARNIAHASSPQSLAILKSAEDRRAVAGTVVGLRLAVVRAVNLHLDLIRFLTKEQ